MVTVMIATTTASIRRDMERKSVILFQEYLATNALYIAMFSAPTLFDEADTDAQDIIAQAADATYEAHCTEYNRLYMDDDSLTEGDNN